MGENCSQYFFDDEVVDVLLHVARVGEETIGTHRLVVRFERLDERHERHLGVHDHAASAREVDHHVGPEVLALVLDVLLFGEIHVVHHARELDHAAQLDLAPVAADVRAAQRIDEVGGLLVELVGSGDHLQNLLAQRRLPLRPRLLRLGGLPLDLVQGLRHRLDQLLDRGLALRRLRLLSLVRALEALLRQLQELLAIRGKGVGAQGFELALHLRELLLEVGDAPLGLLAHPKLALVRPLVGDVFRSIGVAGDGKEVGDQRADDEAA